MRLPALGELKRLLAARGIRLKKSLGQNLLVDGNMCRAIARDSGAGKNDTVLEVGTGVGHLTAALAGTGAAVVTVEIDRGLHEIAGEYLAGTAGVELLHADILHEKELNPEVVKRLEGKRPLVVSNLPYVISGRFLRALFVSPLEWRRAVLTLQEEVARKACARAGEAGYGSLSVLVGTLADARVVRTLPPEVFWPRPEVDSAVVALEPKETEFDRTRFAEFLRRCFAFPRKKLGRAIEDAPDRLASRRPEELSTDEYVELFYLVCKTL